MAYAGRSLPMGNYSTNIPIDNESDVPPEPFVVRSQSGSGIDGAFRVYLSPEGLDETGLRLGELCEITQAEHSGETITGYGLAWRATDKMGSSPKVRPAKMTDSLRNAFSIKEGSHVFLSKTRATIVHADKVVIGDVTPAEYLHGNEPELNDGKWRSRCIYSLCNCEALASGVTFEVHVKKGGVKKRFLIEQIESTGTPSGTPNLFYFDDRTKLVISDPVNGRHSSITNGMDGEPIASLAANRIGGLIEQLEKLNTRMKLALGEIKKSDERQVRPILVHGYEGTGKTLLLDCLQNAPFHKVIRLDKATLNATNTKTKAIKAAFEDALANQPSLVLMDDINEIAPATDDIYTPTIRTELNKLVGSDVLVIATCRSPLDVNSKLIDPSRFAGTIELPIPDQHGRKQILRVLLKSHDDADATIAHTVSLRTHGFTGKDLGLLVYEALMQKADRSISKYDGGSNRSSDASSITLHNNHNGTAVEGNGTIGTLDSLAITDFDTVLKKVRPTALRGILFEQPNVQWDQIGGSSHIKERFDEFLLYPLKYPELMQKYKRSPTKGVLLYGPPGCSKTLTAKAVATTYDLNFISIKGAELISMYVGESERTVREIFRKARQATPCIIFFDEIDSIASKRSPGSTKDLNVLTTLLNEMDGFDSSEGVFVMAATNKPKALDAAILRPGRFTSHIYIGPPTDAARKEIFEINTKGTPTDIDLAKLVDGTEGFTGAEVVSLCDLAKARAIKRAIVEGNAVESVIGMEDFEQAFKGLKPAVTVEMLAEYESFQ